MRQINLSEVKSTWKNRDKGRWRLVRPGGALHPKMTRRLHPEGKYDISIRGPWGMRIDYLDVSYGGVIKRSRPGDQARQVEIHLFWAKLDGVGGLNPVTALPEQILAVAARA